MARAWIVDRWTKSVTVEIDGIKHRIDPPSAQLSSRNLSKLEDRFKSSRFGKGSRWRVDWYEDTPDGSKRLRNKSFKVKADAEAFQAELEDDQRSGRYIDPSLGDRLFKDVAEEWFSRKRDVAGSSRKNYRRDLDLWILPKWGHERINRINRDRVEEWADQLANGTAPNTLKTKPRGHKPVSVERLVKLRLGAVLRYAVSERIISHNPAEGIQLEKPTEVERGYLTVEEVNALTEAATTIAGEAMGLTIVFLAYTGLRRGEMAALRVSDIDLKAKRVRVTKTVTEDNKEGPPKNRRNRSVPIPGFLLERLKKHMSDRPQDDYLFTSPHGERLNTNNWRNRVFDPAVLGAGLDEIPGLVPHSLRHTYASICIANGVDVKTLQTAMGHRKPSTTLDIYAGLWPERLDDLATIMEQAYLQHNHA